MTFDELTKAELLDVIRQHTVYLTSEPRLCALARSRRLRAEGNAEFERYQAATQETLAALDRFNGERDLGRKLLLAEQIQRSEKRAQAHLRRSERYQRQALALEGFRP